MGRVLFGYTVVNLGCKVNRVEADGFERLLAERGGVPVGEAAADLIVVNTCTVTGEAEKKTRKARAPCPVDQRRRTRRRHGMRERALVGDLRRYG